MGPDSHSCAFFLRLFIVRAARPQRKLHYNFTPSGSKGRQIRALPTSSQPLVLQGMQVTCGLPDLMMSFHHQTEKKQRQTGRLPSSTTIDRSINTATDRVRLGQQLQLASRSGITTQFEKLFITAHYILAAF